MTEPPIQYRPDENADGFAPHQVYSRVRSWVSSHPGKAGVLAGWFQQACSVLAALVSYPLIVRHLNGADAGIWFSFQGLLGAINLTDFGLTFVLARQVAYTLHLSEAGGMDDSDFIATPPGWKGVGEIYYVSKRLFAWASIIAGAAMIFIYVLVMHFGKMAAYRSNQTMVAWGLLGIGTVLSLQAKPSVAVIEGCGKVYLVRFIVGICQMLTGLAVIASLLLHAGLGAMALSVCATQVIQQLVLRSAALTQGDFGKSQHNEAGADLLRKLLRVAFPMGILNLSGFLVSSVQVPLLGMVLGPKIVPPFYLAQKIGQMLNIGCIQLVMPQVPLFTRDLANGERGKARRRYGRTMTISCGASFAANLFFWLVTPSVVALWLGLNRYVDHLTLGLMSLDYFMLGVGSFSAQFVLAAGRNPFVMTTATSAIANVTLVFILCPHLGLVGIPAATICAGLITNYWYCPFKGIELMRELRASSERT